MIQRGVTINIKKSDSMFYLLFKVFFMINRVYYPNIIVTSVFSIMFFSFCGNVFYSYLCLMIIIQTIFFSISFHEIIHISYARFLQYNPTFISFIPYNFGVRAHFDNTKKINNLDKICILLSAPLILTFIGLILLLISIIFVKSTIAILISYAFLLINVLSLIPSKKSDGGRSYKIIKVVGLKPFILCLCSFIVFIRYLFGTKSVKNKIHKNYIGDKNG